MRTRREWNWLRIASNGVFGNGRVKNYGSVRPVRGTTLKKRNQDFRFPHWLKAEIYFYGKNKKNDGINISLSLSLILRRSRTGTVRFYTSTSNKRAARPKLYTKLLTRDLKRMYSRFTLVRISINLQAPCVLYIGTGVSLLSRERFLYI